jgi:hypothetical protein
MMFNVAGVVLVVSVYFPESLIQKDASDAKVESVCNFFRVRTHVRFYKVLGATSVVVLGDVAYHSWFPRASSSFLSFYHARL